MTVERFREQKMARYSMYGMAGIGIAAAIGFVLVLGSIGGSIITRGSSPAAFTGGNGTAGAPAALVTASTQNLAKFSSIDELRAFLTNVEASRNAFSTAQTGIPFGSAP